MALLLFVSAILVLYPLASALNAVNTLGIDNTNLTMLLFGVIFIYVFAFSALAYLPEGKSVKVQDLVNIEECPDCGEESLTKVHLNLKESNSAKANPRMLSLAIEYCTNCKKIWVDGQEIRKGGLYDYIENQLISVYGNEAPIEKNETFDTKDFDELLADIEKAKKAKGRKTDE